MFKTTAETCGRTPKSQTCDQVFQILGGMFVIFQNVLSNVQNIRTQTHLSKLATVFNRPLSHAAIYTPVTQPDIKKTKW